MFDRIEAGTYLIAGALVGKRITIDKINPKIIRRELKINIKINWNALSKNDLDFTILKSNSEKIECRCFIFVANKSLELRHQKVFVKINLVSYFLVLEIDQCRKL